MEQPRITCPKCEQLIDVNEILYSQVHSQLNREYAAKHSQEMKALQQKNDALDKDRADLLRLQSEIDTSIALGINKRISSERIKQEKHIRQLLEDEKSAEINSYKNQLEQKVKEVKELNRLKADYQRLSREKLELKEKLEAEAEAMITSQVEIERKKIKKDVETKKELAIAEKEHIIHQLKVQLAEASRKADQGSSQLRGEVMETTLEAYLRQCFPFDVIEEIKKGTKGADSLHFVNTATQVPCGSIYYETKRTKDFQPSWITKFKADMLRQKADIGVLVTQSYPKDSERLSFKDGIWICSLDEAKGLCFVLRESLVLINEAKTAQVNKGGKMEIIYEYMVSNEFRMQMEAIVDAFVTMEKNLLSEKRAMEAIWKQRQKQIEKVILNATHIYSSIRGIAGSAVKPIKHLELIPDSQKPSAVRKLLSKSIK